MIELIGTGILLAIVSHTWYRIGQIRDTQVKHVERLVKVEVTQDNIRQNCVKNHANGSVHETRDYNG